MVFITIRDPKTDLKYSFSVAAADYQRKMEDDNFANALLRHAKINYKGVKEKKEKRRRKNENQADQVEIVEEIRMQEDEEGNLPESPGSDLPVRNKRVWSEEETLLIIQCVEAHYDELNHPKKRKKIWENIAKDMVSSGVAITALECHQKWRNLLRSYKVCKDNIKMTGRPSSRFLFFKAMDEFLGTKYNISSPHTIYYSDILEVQERKRTKIENQVDQVEIVEETRTQEDEEGNLPESSGSDLPVRNKRVWSKEETLLIIRCVEAHYDELNHPKKRKKIWENVANDMVSNGVAITAKVCFQKWKNLLRSYKVCKDNIKTTGRPPSRFLFFRHMDEFLGTKYNVSSPHTIYSNILEEQEETAVEVSVRSEDDGNGDPLDETEAEHAADNSQVSKRKNPRTEYFKAKTSYLAAKHNEMQAKRLQREEYIMKKLELEERKTKAFEELVSLRKTKQPRREAVASSSKDNV